MQSNISRPFLKQKISVSLLTYNAEARVINCLDSIIGQTRKPDEIIVVDNASTDKTVELIRRLFPEVQIKQVGENTGCSGGRNRQILWAEHPFVLVVDDDVLLAPDCLEELEAASCEHPKAAIWAPRVCYDQDRKIIQFDGGGWLHFICEAVNATTERRLDGEEKTINQVSRQVTPRYRSKEAPLPTEPFEITFQGGVSFLIKKEAAHFIGGYDESYFFGRTDGEFSYRLTLSGYKLMAVPRAIVYHRMKERGLRQAGNRIRNRWSSILQTYSLRTIVVLFPALIVYELSVALLLAAKGHLGTYVSANLAVLRNLPRTLRRRREIQRLKVRRDRELLSDGFINMRADIAKNRLIPLGHRFLNVFFKLYWKIFRRFVG